MIKKGIVLGHEVSSKGIEVDKAKVEVIAKLSEPKCIKDIKFFEGMPDSINDLSKSLARLLDIDESISKGCALSF